MGVIQEPVESVVPEHLNGSRADKAVAELAGVSRAVARAMLEEGTATFDGDRMAPAAKVRAGARLIASPPQPWQLAPEPVAFAVLWEDDDIAVVDKPPGVVVHPGAGNQRGTLAAGILARWPQVEGVGEANRWGIVHRLDRDTSGALLVAKTDRAHGSLTEAMATRSVERTYTALVVGHFEIPTGTIDAPIGRDDTEPTKFAVTAEGRHAVTHYRVISPRDEATLIEVKLETGRTHQIRVHLAYIGHPVCGDRTYGRGGGPAVPRIFLHAAELAFDHPFGAGRVEVVAPLPDDLRSVL